MALHGWIAGVFLLKLDEMTSFRENQRQAQHSSDFKVTISDTPLISVKYLKLSIKSCAISCARPLIFAFKRFGPTRFIGL